MVFKYDSKFVDVNQLGLLLFDEYAEKRNFESMQAKNREFHNYVNEQTVYHGILHQAPSEMYSET